VWREESVLARHVLMNKQNIHLASARLPLQGLTVQGVTLQGVNRDRNI
jgi:hypothetical protein